MKLVALLLVIVSTVSASFEPIKTLEGVEFGFANERVVGGQDAYPHSAPWIVSLQYVTTFSRHICGGSIIAADWVVTAAHCLVGLPPPGHLEISAGRHNISEVTEIYEQRRRVDRFWVHESYPGGVAPFDIGLIHLDVPFALTGAVHVIALPQAEAVPSGNVQLHGWGSTSRTTTPIYPDILQTVVKPVLSFTTCRLILGLNSPLHNTNVCTGPITGGVSACSGDSGGPLTQNGELVGIVSWGVVPCGIVGAPSVYVRVSAFVDWINLIRWFESKNV